MESLNQPSVNMFWHGPRLGPVHAACLRSFLRHGHRVVLHGYAAPEDLPEGVERFDARQIMPLADLIANRETGSVALGTNRYRYRMLAAGMGPYVDCDMYCLQPVPTDAYVFGREDARAINNAFLNYPPDSALATALVAETATEFRIPDWLSRRRKALLRVRRALGLGVSVRDMPWGVWGPSLLTHWVHKLGLEHRAQPIDRFYPLHYLNVELLLEPGLRIEDLTTPRSVAIHLCHKLLDQRRPPPGSPLHGIIDS